MSEAVNTPTPGPPRLYRGRLTMLRGVIEGALWGTAAGSLAAGLSGLALYVLDLDVMPLTTTDQGALWILVIVPAVAAGTTMTLRAQFIVAAGYATTPPTGRPTSGPRPLAEP